MIKTLRMLFHFIIFRVIRVVSGMFYFVCNIIKCYCVIIYASHFWTPNFYMNSIQSLLCKPKALLFTPISLFSSSVVSVTYYKVEKDSNTLQGIRIYSTDIGAIFLKFHISKLWCLYFRNTNLVKKV